MNDDIQRSAKRYLLPFLIICVTATSVLLFLDSWLMAALQTWLTSDYYQMAKLITRKGLYLFYAIFAALFIYSYVKKNKKLTDLCLAYLKAQLIFSFALVRLIKIVLGRIRPEYGAEFTFFSFNYRYNSFPSGHAADAFVSGVFLYYLLKSSKYPAGRFLPLIYAFLIAISRVIVNVHHPSDVAAGMGIGILGACFFIDRIPNDTAQKPD